MSFSDAFLSWYNIVIDVILVLGVISFIKLPKHERAKSNYWLPFLILVFIVFYESVGSFFLYARELNAEINAFLGNSENPKYNVWVFNIFNVYLLTILYLFLIRQYLSLKNRKFINGMIVFYLSSIVVLNYFGIQKVYDSQPIIFFISATFLIIASGVYFIMFLKEDMYLDINPLRLFSFWHVTFILFNYSTVFVLFILQKYMWENYYALYKSLSLINIIEGVIILVIFLATIAWPSLNWKYEKQPTNV
jgi:hypothetical protein